MDLIEIAWKQEGQLYNQPDGSVHSELVVHSPAHHFVLKPVHISKIIAAI